MKGAMLVSPSIRHSVSNRVVNSPFLFFKVNLHLVYRNHYYYRQFSNRKQNLETQRRMKREEKNRKNVFAAHKWPAATKQSKAECAVDRRLWRNGNGGRSHLELELHSIRFGTFFCSLGHAMQRPIWTLHNSREHCAVFCSASSFMLHRCALRGLILFFIFFVRKMLFSFTGYHRSKCTYRFHSILFRTTEAESGHCTGTHTLARTERDTSIRISMTLELEFYYFYYNFMFVNGERVQSHGSCSAVAHTHTQRTQSRVECEIM